METLKPYKFRIYLKNGEYYTYLYDDYDWKILKDQPLVIVVDSNEVKWLVLDLNDFSRVEVIAE
jgi:hypothetical protein